MDYNLTTVPIPAKNGSTLDMVAARSLGGGTMLNGATWTKGSKSQYDLWAQLAGDDQWGWTAFQETMKRAEHFYPPMENQTAIGAQYEADAHGFNGTVLVSFPTDMFHDFEREQVNASVQVWPGMQVEADLASGVVNGVGRVPFTLQADGSQNRSSAYTAWIKGEPETRSNLQILLGHRVIKIDWANTTDHKIVASGVQFQESRDAPIMTAKASREVLVAAGSMQSPQLLELSGVGHKDVLAAAGIPLVKNTPGVGANLQEQTKTQLFYTPEDPDFDGSGPSTTIAYPNVYHILGDKADSVYNDTVAGLPAFAAELEKSGYVANGSAMAEILKLQVDDLWFAESAASEAHFSITANTDPHTVGSEVWGLIVLARGSIHVGSNNSWDQPLIDPNYFGHPLDMQLTAYTTRQVRQAYQTEPLASLVTEETIPGLSVVSQNATDAEWEKWVLDNFTSVWHPISTLSAMKEELGGVVDSKLKVYGIENVRVIDASVLPVQLSAHLSSSLYGIALQAVDLIQADQ